jgi:hypothetical protein
MLKIKMGICSDMRSYAGHTHTSFFNDLRIEVIVIEGERGHSDDEHNRTRTRNSHSNASCSHHFVAPSPHNFSSFNFISILRIIVVPD